MPADRAERRLAAILAADMVGYSRLMEADETGTLASLKALRAELIDPTIAAHNGRIVKTTGDGMLAEFGSIVDAVASAVAIQRAMVERNDAVPEDRRIRFRVGINLGDIIFDGDDIYGDGVNIAARLEALAEPGGVCISGTAYEHLKAKVDVGYADLGEQRVKNIEKPVRVYRVLMEPEAAGQTIAAKRQGRPRWHFGAVAAALAVAVIVGGGAWWWQPWAPDVEPARAERMAFPLPDKPSIVVLPFVNLSGDPAQDYFVDGLTETIISQLSKTPQLFVIARNSAFTYKNKPVKVRRVSEELGVRYVLEGSVQRTGSQIRVHAQLIDATTGYHIWSGRYDREAANIFAVQDDIALNIAATIEATGEGQIAFAERARVQSKETKNLQAWDHVQRGLYYWWQYKKETNLLAREEVLKAIQLDPEFARPYAYVGWSHLAEVWFGWADTPKKSVAQAFEWARKAITLDDKEYQGYWVLAEAHMAARQFAEAGAAYEKTLDLNPNDANALMNFGFSYLVHVGRAEEALEIMKKAMRLNPHHPERWHGNFAHALYLLGRYDEAITSINRVTKPRIDHNTILAGSFAQLGQMDKARAVIEKILRERPDYNLEAFGEWRPFENPKDAERWLEGPRKAGLPEHPPLALPDKPSIAVLPFTNMSGDAEQEYFADGITEDIITDLSKISELFVIARNSSFAYKGKSPDLRAVGRELGVKFILEGSVRRAGETVRINAQLVDATTGGHLWAERYDGELKDVFALQDRVTQRIVSALAVRLTAPEQKRVAQRETGSVEAYDAFIKGWGHFRRRTPDDFAAAIPYFKRAIELDPDYGRAYAALAAVYWHGASTGWLKALGASYTTLIGRARDNLEKAIEKKPNSVAYRLTATIKLRQRRYDEALADAEQAVSLDPGNADALTALAWVLTTIGRPKEAIGFAERAMRVDPVFPGTALIQIGRARYAMGDMQAALSMAKRGTEHLPKVTGFRALTAAIYARLGRDEEARREFEVYKSGWPVPITLKGIMYFWDYRDRAVAERFAKDMIRAGRLPPPHRYYRISDDGRLSGKEIRALFFGRTVTGRSVIDRKQLWVERTRDGAMTLRAGYGTLMGKSWVEDELLCSRYDRLFEGRKICGPVFRNLGGGPETMDEYVVFTGGVALPRSPVKE